MKNIDNFSAEQRKFSLGDLLLDIFSWGIVLLPFMSFSALSLITIADLVGINSVTGLTLAGIIGAAIGPFLIPLVFPTPSQMAEKMWDEHEIQQGIVAGYKGGKHDE